MFTFVYIIYRGIYSIGQAGVIICDINTLYTSIFLIILYFF